MYIWVDLINSGASSGVIATSRIGGDIEGERLEVARAYIETYRLSAVSRLYFFMHRLSESGLRGQCERPSADGFVRQAREPSPTVQ